MVRGLRGLNPRMHGAEPRSSCLAGGAAGPGDSPLRRTFLHLPRVGVRTEQRLWREGIRTWDDLEASRREAPDLFGRSSSPLLKAIAASRKALEDEDAVFFAERLPSREHFRIAAEFSAQTVFLDIETTGLSLYYDKITLVGCAQEDRYACHIVGIGNDQDNATIDLIEGAKCLVTFNGTVFDLKFLAKYFPALRLPVAHVDLRYLVRRASLTGGQKNVERALGINRPGDIGEVDGVKAVLLWYEYTYGTLESGRQLVRYNHADVEGMKPILDHAIARIAESADCQAVAQLPIRFADRSSSICFNKTESGVKVPPFPKSTQAAMSYDRLTVSLPDELRVVGIDLTGAESQPSGWCELRGKVAMTRMVGSDDEIIESIAFARPHLVSIDSPLTLPIGRRDVGDEDPTRNEFGIMRRCERTLKRRGINVYPCLILNMQRLTARGIRLASALRARGVAVIESYPGAAQDIMNIPRKRAGLEHLKKGLQRFGIHGDYLHTKVTHDELDAITCAIVGLYFWAGRFEALGNIDEDFLIIPDLQRTICRRRVIGISGPIAAGKTTIARSLERIGFSYGRYSQVLAELATEQGRRPDRETLQQLGHRVHRDPGQRWLNSRLLCRMDHNDADLVIDGLRWPEDHAFWVERFGSTFRHVHVSAPTQLRRARYLSVAGASGEFDDASRHSVESGVRELKALAHLVIENDRDVKNLQHVLKEQIDARLPAEEF